MCALVLKYVSCVKHVWVASDWCRLSCRGSVCADVSGRMGAVVQREHRRPDVQEGARAHRQRRRPPGAQTQPQDPHIPELELSRYTWFHFKSLRLSVLKWNTELNCYSLSYLWVQVLQACQKPFKLQMCACCCVT